MSMMIMFGDETFDILYVVEQHINTLNRARVEVDTTCIAAL